MLQVRIAFQQDTNTPTNMIVALLIKTLNTILPANELLIIFLVFAQIRDY